ncbi:MAG: hypothetical protein U0031_02690 [Thermomicrobiales bacterium]
MDETTFDLIVSHLASNASRRRVFSGLVGAATVALSGGGLAAKTKTSSSHQRRHPGHGGASDKVMICHFTAGRTRAERLAVSGRALRKHLAHGDVRFNDCCVNGDCEVGACFRAHCVSGTCNKTQLSQGTPCQLDWPLGGIGGCTPGGNCVPTVTSGG